MYTAYHKCLIRVIWIVMACMGTNSSVCWHWNCARGMSSLKTSSYGSRPWVFVWVGGVGAACTVEIYSVPLQWCYSVSNPLLLFLKQVREWSIQPEIWKCTHQSKNSGFCESACTNHNQIWFTTHFFCVGASVQRYIVGKFPQNHNSRCLLCVALMFSKHLLGNISAVVCSLLRLALASSVSVTLQYDDIQCQEIANHDKCCWSIYIKWLLCDASQDSLLFWDQYITK